MAFPLRSSHEKLAGYYHLGRFVDKIRLNAIGKLPEAYQKNFTHGLDNRWLTFAGLDVAAFLPVVEAADSDAVVAAWVEANVKHTPAEIAEWNQMMVTSKPKDPARIEQMRAEAGHAHRTDVDTYFDLIDLDEGRSVPQRG